MVSEMENIDVNNIALAVIWYAVLLVSFVFHEAAHGFAALKLGDPTAYLHGQVTLDPLPHIRREPVGMVVFPLLTYALGGFMIGWASAPYDPYWARANRKKAALMAIAGPAANLGLVLLAGLAIRGGMLLGIFEAPESVTLARVTAATSAGFAHAVAVLVSILFSLNLILLTFNLIPLPPLDGSNVLVFFLSEQAADRYESFLSQPTYRLLGLVIAWQLFDPVFSVVHLLALNALYPGHWYS